MGVMEETGVYERIPVTQPVPIQEVLDKAPAVLANMQRRPVSQDAAFLWSTCVKEHNQGWASPLLPIDAVHARFGHGAWAPIPSFCHTQAC
eukprot:5971247-Amphidinium_carterae.1